MYLLKINMHIAINMKFTIPFPICFILSTGFLLSCKNNDHKNVPSAIDSTMRKMVETIVEPQKENLKPTISYHWLTKKEWQSKKDSFEGLNHLDILTALNRVDEVHLKRLDSIIVPNDFSKPLPFYMPFPEQVDLLKDVKKIIFFSYPTQTFAAYENGTLVKTGPTSMGKKSTPTPHGLFFTNWKAKKTISTANDEWVLKWNFNISNKGGVGFHEYALPGYPASHSCMRLLSSDAQFLYSWADQWILKSSQILASSGTPVLVFGKYPFGQTKPWLAVVENSQSLNISTDSLNTYIQPHLKTILEKQHQRDDVVNSSE